MKDSLFLPKHPQDRESVEKRFETGPSPDRVLEDKARTPLARLAKKELNDDLRTYSPYEQEEIFGHILDPRSWIFNTALFGRYTGFDFDIPPDAFAGLRPWQKKCGQWNRRRRHWNRWDGEHRSQGVVAFRTDVMVSKE